MNDISLCPVCILCGSTIGPMVTVGHMDDYAHPDCLNAARQEAML